MKQSIICVLFLMLSGMVSAQGMGENNLRSPSSIPSDQFSKFMEYRLPSWGYSEWYLDIDGNTSILNQSVQTGTLKNTDHRLTINPVHRKLMESESRVSMLSLSLNTLYQHSSEKLSQGTGKGENKFTDKSIVLDLEYDFRSYVTDVQFVSIQTINNWSYEEEFEKDEYIDWYIEDQNETTTFKKRYNSTLRFGFGAGRVRDITPMIRAVRFQQRYQRITGQEFFSQAVHSLADHFTTRNGFERIYDRPAKHFYGAFPEPVKSSLTSMALGDLFYLTETFSERLARRHEGAEFAAGAMLDFAKATISEPFANDEQEEIQVGAYGTVRYYHNLSGVLQIGGRLDADGAYPVHTETDIEKRGSVRIRLEGIWNIVDKVAVTQAIILGSEFGWGALEGFQDESYARVDQYRLNGTVDYFIENRLSLFANYNILYTESWLTDSVFHFFTENGVPAQQDRITRNLIGSIGIRYYFKRTLN